MSYLCKIYCSCYKLIYILLFFEFIAVFDIITYYIVCFKSDVNFLVYLNSLANFVVSFPVYPVIICTFFFGFLKQWLCFVSFCIYTVIFMILMWKPFCVIVYIYFSSSLQLFAVMGRLWVCGLNYWICLLLVGGDVWTSYGWLLCCLMAFGIFLFLCYLFWSASLGQGLIS